MNYIKFYNLKPGDKVEVPKSGMNIIQHHVIVLGENYQGEDLIAENVAGLYVRIVTAEEFFRANPKITRITKFKGSNSERRIAIERALGKIGASYDIINFNCEHFANYVQSGESKSNQVSWGLFALGLIVIAILSD